MTAHGASRQRRRTGVGSAPSAATWRAIASSRARLVRGPRSPSSGRYRHVVGLPGSNAVRLVLACRAEVSLESRRFPGRAGALRRVLAGAGAGESGPHGRYGTAAGQEMRPAARRDGCELAT